MLLVPLVGDLPVAKLARDHDALLIASRPRGLIVQGDRDALFWPLLHVGVMTIAAPAGYCGDRG
jgi:hypothetical protein